MKNKLKDIMLVVRHSLGYDEDFTIEEGIAWRDFSSKTIGNLFPDYQIDLYCSEEAVCDDIADNVVYCGISYTTKRYDDVQAISIFVYETGFGSANIVIGEPSDNVEVFLVMVVY